MQTTTTPATYVAVIETILRSVLALLSDPDTVISPARVNQLQADMARAESLIDGVLAQERAS